MKPTQKNVTMQQHLVPMPPKGKAEAKKAGMTVLKKGK